LCLVDLPREVVHIKVPRLPVPLHSLGSEFAGIIRNVLTVSVTASSGQTRSNIQVAMPRVTVESQIGSGQVPSAGVAYEQLPSMEKPHIRTIIIGYIIALLGGWLGFFVGASLMKKHNSADKLNGTVILALSPIMVVVWIVLWLRLLMV